MTDYIDEMNLSNKICWLCLENKDELIEIYGKQGIELSVGAILQEHFWFEDDTFAAKNICGNCWAMVESFHVFYNFVKSIHQHQTSETKTIIDNGLVYSIYKEEPIDIKDVVSDIADTTDFPASDKSEVDTNMSTVPAKLSHMTQSVKRVILASSDFNHSTAPIKDEVKIVRGTSERLTVSRRTRNFKGTISASSDFKDSLDSLSDKVKVVHSTSKRPVVSHKSRNFERSVLASFETNDFPTSRADKPELDSGTTKEPFTAQRKTGKYERKKSTLLSTDEKDAALTSLVSQYFKMACDLCDTSFSSYRDIKKHYRQVHDILKGYLICCKKKYDRLDLMLSHCEWHINPDAFKCDQCSKTFRDKGSRRRHSNFVHQKIEFSCNKCNQKFSSRFLLSAHRKEHSNLQFKCPICEECFTGKINLRFHIRHNHSPEDEEKFRSSMKSLKKVDQVLEEARQFECDICNRRFIHLSVLRNHIKREHNHRSVRDDGSHICEICAKPFTSMHGYKSHYMNFHTNELQKVQCDLCGKWFKSKLRIAQHMSWHNSKPATCKICGHVSSNQYALRGHISRVHREASLECVVCGKKFKSKKVLQEHMAIHAGITDLYTCTFCTKTFRSNANMYSHRKRAHPAEHEKWSKERKERHLI